MERSSTSGARYQRVDMYSVYGGVDRISRARPKSAILMATCSKAGRSIDHMTGGVVCGEREDQVGDDHRDNDDEDNLQAPDLGRDSTRMFSGFMSR